MATKRQGKTAKRVTSLSGLAEHVGLSPTTVSFVLNGQAEQRKIAPQTAKRVMDAAKELDYVPNVLARGLRQKRTQAIGVVFPHLRGDWAHRIMKGISEVLGSSGAVPLIVCHHGSGELESKLLRSLVERRVDGILCNPLADGAERYRHVKDWGVPLVLMGDTPRGLDDISYVAWDTSAVAVATKHLIKLGHKRIAYLGIRDNRRNGIASRHMFRDAMEDAGLECPRRDIILNEPGEPFDQQVLRLLDRDDPPTALFALYDDIAISVLELLRSRGVKCPEDISIATIGGAPLVSAPGYEITTVKAPVEEEGRVGAECLLQMIENPSRGPIHRLVPGGQLVVGRTTSAP